MAGAGLTNIPRAMMAAGLLGCGLGLGLMITDILNHDAGVVLFLIVTMGGAIFGASSMRD